MSSAVLHLHSADHRDRPVRIRPEKILHFNSLCKTDFFYRCLFFFICCMQIDPFHYSPSFATGITQHHPNSICSTIFLYGFSISIVILSPIFFFNFSLRIKPPTRYIARIVPITIYLSVFFCLFFYLSPKTSRNAVMFLPSSFP